MKTVVKEWIQIVFGLLVFALGVHLTIFANIGLAPWDCLGMGIAKHTPLNYGLSMTTMAVVILCIDLMLKERIGFGTIIDALLTGNLIQMFNSLNPFPENASTLLGIVLMLTGLAIMAVMASGPVMETEGTWGNAPSCARMLASQSCRDAPVGKTEHRRQSCS